MHHRGRGHFLVALLLSLMAMTTWAGDVCFACGRPIDGAYYLINDQVAGTNQIFCSKCFKLPRCFICGLPVKDNGIALPDGRCLCPRDGKTAVLKAEDARRIADEVNDSLNKLFSRFTAIPTNVDVTVLDRIDVDKMFQPGGYDFESPNLLGCITVKTNASLKRYSMRLLSGLPSVELKATAAHEFSHAWVAENVPQERRDRLSPDAEEGFCELVAYLLMDSQHEEAQKRFILQNHYTRGQVRLFIAAEQRFGFNQILDWMQKGEASSLEEGRLDDVRNIAAKGPVSAAIVPASHTNESALATRDTSIAIRAPAPLKLQGILWDNPPAAIINGRMIFTDDRFKLKIGATELSLHCLEIRKSSVRIENSNSGEQNELQL
jgi:hypothetical protein